MPFTPIMFRNDGPIRKAHEDHDFLNFTPLAREIAAIAVGTDGPFTLGITAKWGHGKTSMLYMVQDLIQRFGETRDEAWRATHITVWFNAWQYEREADPIVPLLLSIKNEMEKSANLHESFWTALPEKTWSVFRKVPAAIGAVASGLKVKSEVGVPGWLQFLTGLGGKVSGEYDVAKAVEKFKEVFAATEATTVTESALMRALADLNQISEDLCEASLGKEAVERPKVVVFIDDLDRCHPDAALRLLDGIKLVLSQPGFFFVLALDKTILEEHLVKRYRDDFGASNPEEVGQRYIDKIVQLEIPLPPSTGRFAGSSAMTRSVPGFQGRGFLERVAIDVLEGTAGCAVADVLRYCRDLSPRDVVRLLLRLRVDMALFRGTLTPAAKTNDRSRDPSSPPKEETVPFKNEEVAVAATIMRLIESAFDGSHRRDFIDLVLDQGICGRLSEALQTGFSSVTPSESGESTASANLSLTEAIFAAIRRPRGLADALRAHGELWLTDARLRRRLLEFLDPNAEEELFDMGQFEMARDAIRRSLDLREGEPLPNDLSGVKRLAFPPNINDEGLRMLLGCTGLESLDLQGSRISDYSPLSRLTRLTTLNLTNSSFRDLTAVGSPTSLTELQVENTPVRELRPLMRSLSLRLLNVSGTGVESLEALAECSGLEALFAAMTPLSNIDPLRGLKRLQILDLYGSEIRDIDPLADLVDLTNVDLGGTKVAEIGSLVSLKGLVSLGLSETSVRDLTALADLNELRSLDISKNPVKDLTPLIFAEKLETLSLAETDVVDVSPLSGLTQLRSLELSRTLVEDIKPLASLVNLEDLSLALTRVVDAKALLEIPSLKSLRLPSNFQNSSVISELKANRGSLQITFS